LPKLDWECSIQVEGGVVSTASTFVSKTKSSGSNPGTPARFFPKFPSHKNSEILLEKSASRRSFLARRSFNEGGDEGGPLTKIRPSGGFLLFRELSLFMHYMLPALLAEFFILQFSLNLFFILGSIIIAPIALIALHLD
jgi:hypothetical protein